MLEFLLALSIWGWIGLLALVCFLIIMVETESDYLGFALIAAMLGSAVLVNGFGPVVSWLYANAGSIALWAAGWVAVGLAWSVFKWDRFMAAAAERYAKNENEVLIPSWTSHKSKLTSWTVWWPFSMLAYVLGDLLREAINWCLSLMGRLYEAITNRHFKDLPDPKTKMEAKRARLEEAEARIEARRLKSNHPQI